MKNQKFVVSQYENYNGTSAWRVDGRLHGVRIRKNFKTREEAAAEKSALEIKSLQTVSGLRDIATSLTTEQVREAEALAVALYCVRPDLINGVTLEQIGEMGGIGTKGAFSIAKDFRISMGLAA